MTEDFNDYSYLIKGSISDVEDRARKYGLSYGQFSAKIVGRCFEAYCLNAGYPLPPGRKRETADVSVKQLHANGLSDAEIAAVMGVSRMEGTQMREAAGLTPNKGESRKKAAFDRMVDEGLPLDEISRELLVPKKILDVWATTRPERGWL